MSAAARFRPGQVVKGHHMNRVIFAADVIAVDEENDTVTVDVTWGHGDLVRRTSIDVPATWLELKEDGR